MINLLTAKWCVSCKELKWELKRKGVDVNEIDVESDEGAQLVGKHHIRALPTVIHIDEIISGKNEILQHLKDWSN